MSILRRLVAAVAMALMFIAAPASLHAQDVRIDLPQGDPFPAAPEIVVHALNFGGTFVRIRLLMATNQDFGLVVFDSTIASPDARFLTKHLLPENTDIYVRASVLDANGQAVVTTTAKAGRTGQRLALLSPNGKTSVVLGSTRPQFSWTSAPISIPPGPWLYELSITNVARQETRSRINIQDTVYTWPDTLQANTSYRWKVTAHPANGYPEEIAVASSESSFIIAPSNAPVATLLYQNFPNPFPAPSSATTCIWFDLQLASHVELTILDARGNRVKTLIPGVLGSELGSGRYGRRGADLSGCDPRLAWDGTADNGRVVPPGIYLVRFKTSTAPESIKKILFLGR